MINFLQLVQNLDNPFMWHKEVYGLLSPPPSITIMDGAFCIIKGPAKDNNAEIVFEDYQELLTDLFKGIRGGLVSMW